jgi:hypothetical protein
MPSRVLIAAFAFLCFASTEVEAWSSMGHVAVAEIAWKRLSPKARAATARLLGPEIPLDSVADWADRIRWARPETKNWHFVDIPLNETRYLAARDCPESEEGDCIVAELQRLRHALACPESQASGREAFSFAVHFVGDLHQPLHALREMRGGNEVKVLMKAPTGSTPKKRSKGSNLHHVWDEEVLRGNWDSPEALAAEGLEAASLPAKDFTDPIRWAEESHRVAQDVWTWPTASEKGKCVIDAAYLERARQVAARQIGRAGIRLAAFLESAFSQGCGK